MRYRAIVEYDGTAYRGFQRQLAERTIQGEIEKSLEKISAASRRGRCKVCRVMLQN